MNKLSIIIPTFNRAELLKYNFISLSHQDMPIKYEVIILNEHLRDDGVENLCKVFSEKINIKYIFTGVRNKPEDIKWRIPGFAFNIGVKQATGDAIILTCPEIVHFGKNCIKDLIEPLYKQEKIIVYPTSVKDDSFGYCLNEVRNNEGIFNSKRLYEMAVSLKEKYPFFLGMPRKEYLDIGGYDEDFVGNCFDDADFYNRLLLNNNKYVSTQAKALHLYHKRLPYKESEEVMRKWEYNKKLYEERINIIKRNENKEWGIIK